MRKHLTLFIYLLVALNAHAQMGKTMSHAKNEYINRDCKAYYPNILLSRASEYEGVVKLIAKESQNFKDDNSSVVLDKLIKAPYSRHYTFHQIYGNIDIYNSQVKVNVDTNGRVFSIFDNSVDTRGWNISLINAVKALDSTAIVIPFIKGIQNVEAYLANKVIFADGEVPQAAYSLTVRTTHPMRQWVYLLDNKGSVLFKADAAMYAHAPGDTIVKAKVYYPDPITSGHTVYDTTTDFANHQYKDNATLTAQEKLVDIHVYHDPVTDSIYLADTSNNYIVGHTGGSLNGQIPVRPVASPAFLYTRNNTQSAFLYTNAFYWLSRMRRYLDDTLKIGVALPKMTNVDPMADISDNSDFLYGFGTSPNWFEFGTGGVPDAEDADVILHEHGHFLSYSLAPSSVSNLTYPGFERLSVDEGQADYWAASHSRSINIYQADWVFNWDGHNEFWPGRICNTTDVYKGPGWSLSGIHHNGQIWSTAMMDIWKQYGREVADRLEIQANLSFALGMTMPQAAYLVLKADTILFKGAHSEGICLAFGKRNLFNGNCRPQDTAIIWHIPETVKLSNSLAFGSNSDYAYITANKFLYNVSIRIYNLSGQLLQSGDNLNGSRFILYPTNFIPGAYIIQVVTSENSYVFKVAKWQ